MLMRTHKTRLGNASDKEEDKIKKFLAVNFTKNHVLPLMMQTGARDNAMAQQVNLKKIEEESQLIFGFQAIQSMCGFIPVSEGLSLVTAVRLCHLTSWHPC